MKTVLVTGGKGFVGSEIVKKLRRNGYKVFPISRSYSNDGVVCDLSQISYDELLLKIPTVDFIVHTACNIPRNTSEDNDSLYNENILIDELIFKLSSTQKIPIIYISTCGLYKRSIYSLDENSDLIQSSNYFKSKYQGEILFRSLKYATILRISSPFGVGMNQNVVISKFIAQAINTKNILLWGDGLRAQNFIHVKDIADSVDLVILHNSYGTFNITADFSCSMTELAITIMKQFDDCTLEYVPDEAAETGHNYLYSNHKAYKELYWSPKKNLVPSLIEMIRDTETKLQ